MALVERFHVVAAERDVATGETIKEGQLVALDALGNAVLASTNAGVYGIAADTKSTSASSMPGVAAGWQNRVSDYFDETKASGKMTVYHSGGEFATDQFDANVAATGNEGDLLYGNANGVLDLFDEAGETASTLLGVFPVAKLLTVPGEYPSGVPGTDISGDIALSGENNNTYIEFKLLV
jgi:hypothetical protein